MDSLINLVFNYGLKKKQHSPNGFCSASSGRARRLRNEPANEALASARSIGHDSLSSAWEQLAATFQFRDVLKHKVAILRLQACGVPRQ